jgi:hypothetical protein
MDFKIAFTDKEITAWGRYDLYEELIENQVLQRN